MPKKDVSLVVCDIDNTISDTFNLWGEALDKAVDDLAALHKTDRKTMEETLLAAVPESNRGSSGPLLGINIRADIAQTPALQGNTPEEKAFFAKEHEKIIHNWQKKRDEAVLFKGVLPDVLGVEGHAALVAVAVRNESVRNYGIAVIFGIVFDASAFVIPYRGFERAFFGKGFFRRAGGTSSFHRRIIRRS